ncbi:MAG: TrmH family RNA methyltransferase [Bryobacteraceae bacterium]
MHLTSAKNPFLESVRRAAAAGRPMEDGSLVIEGPHLVAEALRGGCTLRRVVTTAQGRERYAKLLERLQVEITEVSSRAFAATASTETAQEILALAGWRPASWRKIAGPQALVVALDGIQDPGNAGTIVRSAEAFGASGVVLLEGTVRVANGKFLRATAGSIFRLPVLEAVKRVEFLEQARASGLALYALSARGGTSLPAADLCIPSTLIVGGEGSGVSAQLFAASTALSVPARNVESLNAAVACSIALFETARQRGTI